MPPWVDQAREIAVGLLAVVRGSGSRDELMDRIARDPALFWLRGEVEPVGIWRR
jgi:hypothetical protein